MRYFSDTQWNAFLKVLSDSHGELTRHMCKMCESLVKAMFHGTLDSYCKFPFEDVDETQIDIQTKYLLSSIQLELS